MAKISNPLDNPVQYVKSIGPKRAEMFGKIGIEKVRDLLFYFPSKHLDRTTIINSSKAIYYAAGGYEGELTVIGTVVNVEDIHYGKKEILKVNFRDSAGFFECVWFQGARYIKDIFKIDETYAISSRPVVTKYGHLQFTHPDFDRITEDESSGFFNTGKIIPFYRVPKELKAANIGDLGIRRIIHHCVEEYAQYAEETLPQNILQEHELQNIGDSIRNIHFPEDSEKLAASMRRFKFEELFYLQILIALRKYNFTKAISGYPMKVQSRLVHNFLAKLPFELTKGQLSVLSEIRKDMEKPHPMNRLLQGEVGSGKTIVALISMLIAIDNGYQTALMAPTEILADQHYRNITRLLEGLGIRAALLLGGQKKKERDETLARIVRGEINIVIGTHALLEENVQIPKLGLAVIDEQHRFGVAQRSKLINKSQSPDVLIMTATPIPRTLTMSVYGDLDLSVISEMPKNRLPIKTLLRSDGKLPDIYKFIIEKNKSEGYQAFIVFPLVQESEKMELKAAEKYYDELQNGALKDIRLGMIHGKMPWKDKEEIMFRFAAKEFDALISTSVIEVGIDIPDANIIVINDAHRFGLSQLHQLRGRVGRGSKQAYCILVSQPEFIRSNKGLSYNFEYLSAEQIEKNKSRIRLNAMEKSASGFEISEIDLRLRGPGDIFGIKQSGMPELRFADLAQDSEILMAAKDAAFALIDNDPKLARKENSIIAESLRRSYSKNLSYAKIA
jgi:ATP-dependent DNA helicase RecG